MKRFDPKQWARLGGIAGLVILLDQVTKALVLNYLPLYRHSGDSISLIPGFFNLTHIQNPGGAFGLLANQSPQIRTLLFMGVSTLAVFLLLYFYFSTPPTHRWLSSAFAAILGGAVGNLIDRFRFGYVVDFLDFFVRGWHWPAFNVADSAITVGITIFIIHLVFNKMPE